MKILKYKKIPKNKYKILTDNIEYILYDDIIIKYELLLKKEISDKEIDEILKDNKLLDSYYDALKLVNIKLRTKNEINKLLTKKNYQTSEINYAIERLEKEGYLNKEMYIEAYIHDALTLNTIGEKKIINDLEKLGFNTNEISKVLSHVDKNIYLSKIENYINKKLKVNRKSANEFKRKITYDLINKGFNKEDIIKYLDNIKISDNKLELEKIINKLYKKYIIKYDIYTTKLKIKNYLYSKGYTNIDIDTYIKRTYD